MYVPSTLAEIVDRLGAMELCMPDKELPVTGLGFDGAYEQLAHSLGLVRAKLGEDRYEALISMARQSKQLFVEGKHKEARSTLYEMKRVLRNRR